VIKQFPKYIILTIVIIVMCVSVFVYLKSAQKDYMEIAFLDVGQGDAVLITSPNGNRMLVDSGTPDKKVEYSIENELSLSNRKINIFLASHPDADHIGGFEGLLNKFTPTYYLDGHTLAMSSLFSSLESKITKESIKRNTLGMGANINLGGGVIIYVLSPVQDNNKEYLDSNNASIVLLVKYGESKILLTGDLEEKEELRLVKLYGKSLKSNILKVGHHGSKSSTGENFLKMVKPDYSVISVGKNNKYGHPSLSTINRLSFASTTILETAKQGTIRFRCTDSTCTYINHR
jgi:competence protein ComEC